MGKKRHTGTKTQEDPNKGGQICQDESTREGGGCNWFYPNSLSGSSCGWARRYPRRGCRSSSGRSGGGGARDSLSRAPAFPFLSLLPRSVCSLSSAAVPRRSGGEAGDLSDQPRAGGWSGLAWRPIGPAPCRRLVRSRRERPIGPALSGKAGQVSLVVVLWTDALVQGMVLSSAWVCLPAEASARQHRGCGALTLPDIAQGAPFRARMVTDRPAQ